MISVTGPQYFKEGLYGFQKFSSLCMSGRGMGFGWCLSFGWRAAHFFPTESKSDKALIRPQMLCSEKGKLRCHMCFVPNKQSLCFYNGSTV